MAATSSSTLQNTPRRMRFCVSWLNQLSTRLSHDGAGRGEVEREARMGRQPGPHGRMFMRAVVVQNEVEVEARGERAVELAKKLQELLMPMPAVALADDLPGQHVQRGEQGRCPVALVVMRECPTGGPSSSAARAASGPAPECDSSRPHTARRPSRADSCTAPRRPSASPRTRDRSTA